MIMLALIGLIVLYICFGGLATCAIEDYYHSVCDTTITGFIIWPLRLCVIMMKILINIWPLSKRLFAYLYQLPGEVKEIITEDWNA